MKPRPTPHDRGARLLAHQQAALEPAWRTLQRHRGLLVSWPLGTGKTWLACGLTRLAVARAGLVPCVIAPARLLPMWRRVDGALGGGVAVFASHRTASLDALPRPAPPTRLLWVVDEAHAFRNPSTLRHRALALAVAAGRVVLLTATPFNTALSDVEALLDLFGGRDPDVPVAESLARVTLLTPQASPPSTVVRRAVDCAPCAPDVLGAWRQTIDAVVEAPWPVFSPDLDPSTARALLCDALLGRLLAHPVALQHSLRRLRRYYSGCRAPNGELLDREAFARLFGRGGPMQGLLPFAWDTPGITTPGLSALRDDVLATIARAERALRLVLDAPDPRLDTLDTLLRQAVGPPDRRWHRHSPHPAVLFTTSADVAHHVAATLGLRGWATGLLTGSRAERCGLPIAADTLLATLDPDATVDRAAHVQVLVCTDVLGQGHNLQRATTLVHLDRPWNPVRLTQREGRLVRHGQRADTVELVTLRPDPGHDALASLVARLDRALATRRADAARLQRAVVAPTAPERPPGARAAPAVTALLARLMARVRPVRRHPNARDWLARIGALRRGLCARPLPTGTRLVLDGLLAGELDARVDQALAEVEAALAPVLG